MMFNWFNVSPHGSKHRGRLARRTNVARSNRPKFGRSTTLIWEQLEERLPLANGITIENGGAINTAAALIQAQNAGDFSFANTGTFSIDPNAFSGAGAITLQANNDVTITGAINDGNAGDSLTIQAGRSITDNADITYETGLNLTANSHLAAVGAGTAGTAAFTMGVGATIRSSASIHITLDSGIGLNATGNVSLATLAAPAVTIADEGPTAGSSIVDASGGEIISPMVILSAVNGTIGQNSKSLNVTTATVTAQAASGIYLLGSGSLTLGNITNHSGEVDIAAVGSIAVNGAIADNDASANGVVILNSAVSGTTPADITFGASGVVAADNQTFIAGDGDTATSAVDFTHAILLGPTGAGSSPAFFTVEQDAPIADAPLSPAQFGNGIPLNYALISRQGSVAVATAADVAGSNLVLTSNAGAGAGGVDLGEGTSATFTLASLSANATAGNFIQIDSTAAAPQITTAGTVGSSTNGMIFDGALSLSHDATLDANNGGGVDFASPSANNVGNSNSLTVNAGGAVTVGGGGFAGCQDFTLSGAAINLDGSVTNNGSTTFNGPVLVGAAVTIFDDATTFNGTIDSEPGTSQFDLTVDSTSGSLFEGNIGTNNPLNSLTVGRNFPAVFAGATIVNTIGDQNYSGNVTVDNDLVLNSTTGSVTFFNLLDSGATPANLTIDAAGQVVFGQTLGSAVGSVDPFGQLIVTATSIELNGDVTTVGDQIYNGPVVLSNNVELNTAVGAVVDFASTIDGAQGGSESLTIGNTNVAGEVIFGGNVGTTNSLAPLNVSATRIFINGDSVNTDGSQTYSGDVFLGGTSPPITLNSGATGNLVSFNGDLTLGASATQATDTLDVTGVFTLSANSMLYSTLDGTATYGNVSASTSNLANANLSLTFLVTPTLGDTYTLASNVGGTTTFANVIADGATKFYVSAQDFTATNATGLTLTAVNPTDAPLTVGISGTYSTIQAAIDASISGDVIEIDDTNNDYAGFTTNNGSNNVSLLFDVVGGGNVAIDSAVTLTADTAFELSGTGLTFVGSSATIDGDVNLTVFAASTGLNLNLQAAVGGSTPLNSFTTRANVATQLDTDITTNANSGGQTFYGNVQLQTSLAGHLATLAAKTATFNAAVGDGVAGGGEDSLSVVGNAVFFGASNVLGGLTVSGETFLDNGGITTKSKTGFGAGNQTYSGAVILGTAFTTLNTGGPTAGALSATSFFGTSVNTNSLALGTFSSPLTVSGGELSDVQNLTVDGAVDLTGDIVTGGTQTYDAAVTLTGDTTLTAFDPTTPRFQTVLFSSTVSGNTDTLVIDGNADFMNNVTVKSLAVLGTTTFNTAGATNTTTTNGQTYLQAVTNTGAENDFTDGSAGVVFDNSYTDNNNPLTITGNAAFNGDVTAFDSLTVTGIATIQNNAANISSNASAATGNITFHGSTTLANIYGGTLTIGTTVGAITLNAVAGGGNNLAIDGDNGVTFDGVVSNVANLVANDVNNVAIVVDTTAITTSGTQTYSNAVQLGASADLTGATVNLDRGARDGNAGTDNLTITGDAMIGDSIGGNAPASLTVVGATTINPAASGTPIALDTVGNQTYEGAFTIGTNVATLSLTTAPTITFDGPIAGDSIELDIQNGAVFEGVVNGVGVLNVSGTAAINGGVVNSTDTQTYSGAVSLGQPAGSLVTNTVLTAAGAASSIVLSGAVGVGGASTSLSVFADDNVDFGAAVSLASSGGTLAAVADSTGIAAAGSGDGQIFISGAVNTFGGSALLAGSAFNDTSAINAGSGTIDLAPSVTGTAGVGAGTDNFQVTNAQLAGLAAGLLAIGGVDATCVTVNGADATASGVTGPVYLISGPLNTGSTPDGEIQFTSSASQFNTTANSALVCVTNGAITIGADVSASNQITLTAGGNLTISTGTTVASGAGAVTFNVGAANTGSSSMIEGAVSGTNVLVQGGSGNDDLTLNYTQGASLPDGLTFNGGGGGNTLTVTDAGGTVANAYIISGSGVTRDGAPSIALASVQSVSVTGGNGNDVFNVTPSASVTFSLDGGPSNPGGDQLNYQSSGLPVRVVPGKFTANFLQDVIFANFEGLNIENAAGVNAMAGPDTADRSIAFAGLTADERFIQTLYLDDLGRTGSQAELASWLVAYDSGGSTAVASGIQDSHEARDHLVKSWYLTYFGRAANGAEEQVWVGLLATESQEQVLGEFLSDGGHEFYNHAQTLISSGTEDERYIEALYLLLLDRGPSAGELQYWVNTLPQIGLQGIALGFLHATEFRTNQFESYYNALLHRPSDAPGLNSLVTSSLDTAQVAVDFGGSPEFFSNG